MVCVVCGFDPHIVGGRELPERYEI